MNIDTQMMTVEEYIGAVQILGVLLYLLLPTMVVLLTIYGIRKILRKRNKGKNIQGNNTEKINKPNVDNKDTKTTKTRSKQVVFDINSMTDKELSDRIDVIEKSGKPERICSLTLTFDKNGKIEQ